MHRKSTLQPLALRPECLLLPAGEAEARDPNLRDPPWRPGDFVQPFPPLPPGITWEMVTAEVPAEIQWLWVMKIKK